MWLALACRAPSTEPHTHDCKTAWKPFASRAPIGQRWVSAVYRSVRKVFGLSYLNHIAFTTLHPIVDKLPATGEDVFNLEVADDHSYIAAGVAVHNCDLLAHQNLYGLGKGVYPDAKRCPWPAHPNTLSFVEMVFADEVTAADKAGKETPMQAMARLPADVRDGVLGKTKATYFDKGLLGQGAIRSTLKAVETRLERTGALVASATMPDSKKVVKFATEAMSIADRQTVQDLGQVANADLILKKTGHDVNGFTRVIDNYGVRHTIKQHGNAAKEAKRGQIAVTLEDFGKIGLITATPDDVFADGKNKIGRDVIVFTKVIDGIGYRHVEEIRGKNKLVATDSMRKKKGAWSA